MKLNRVYRLLALGFFVGGATFGAVRSASAAPTFIDCPRLVKVESDFNCSFRASPNEVVFASTNGGVMLTQYPQADAYGNGQLTVAASWQAGYYSVCVGALDGTSYVCDNVQVVW